MSGKRYTDEFKSEAAKQVIEHGRSVREVSGRLGISEGYGFNEVGNLATLRHASQLDPPRRSNTYEGMNRSPTCTGFPSEHAGRPTVRRFLFRLRT